VLIATRFDELVLNLPLSPKSVPGAPAPVFVFAVPELPELWVTLLAMFLILSMMSMLSQESFVKSIGNGVSNPNRQQHAYILITRWTEGGKPGVPTLELPLDPDTSFIQLFEGRRRVRGCIPP
jgi:hypothetical protein